MEEYITQKQIRQDLLSMGFKASDRILIHSSLRAIGPIEGGAEGLIDVLLDYFSQGTVLMPAHTWDYVNAKHPKFYHAASPSCVGTLSEVFRKTPGTIRSAHPTHSNSGWGRGVKDLLADQERFDTPCAPQSTYGRLAEEGFKIVLIGVDFTRNTTIHGLEERAKIPGIVTEEREPLEVVFADGRVVSSPQHRHTGGDRSEQYDRAEAPLLEKGILNVGKLGRARTLYLEAAPMFDVILDLLAKDPDFFSL